MARKIELGAPSFMKAALVSLNDLFGDAVYPIKVAITNNMPRDISLPDLKLFLRHVSNPDGENKRIIEIGDYGQLRRLASNIEQISHLNGYEYAALTVEGVTDEPEQDGGEEAEAARIQAELDAEAEKAKVEAERAAAEAESKTGDELGSENDPDLTGTSGESSKIPVAGDDGKDATPPDAPKKASHSHKTKGG